MSHEAHNDSAHAQTESKPTTSSRASFWFVVILAGVFIAAVNFVSIMGHDSEEHGVHGHATEHVMPAHDNMHEEGHHAADMHNTNQEAE